MSTSPHGRLVLNRDGSGTSATRSSPGAVPDRAVTPRADSSATTPTPPDTTVPPTTAGHPEWRRTWLDAIRRAGAIWLLFTVLRYFVAALTEYFLQPDHGRMAQGIVGFLKLPFTFDSAYFAEIANNGYFGQRTAPEWRAFFPGYALVMRGTSYLLTLDVSWGRLMVAGAFISAVCSLIATVVIYRMADSLGGARAGICAALLLMLWPSATFLTAAYSESLYLALATGAWWNALKGRWWISGMLCAYASFTRINGVFLAISLLVLLLVRVRRREEPFRVHKLVAVGVGMTGAAAYLLYLWAMTGDPQAWQHAQFKGWGRETVWPWTSLHNTLESLGGADWYQGSQFVLDMGAVLLCILAAAYLGYRRCWAEMTLILLTIGVLVTSSTYLSITRNTLTLFPLFVFGGALLARRREWFTAMLLTLSGMWMVATTAVFTLTKWVG